MGTESDNTGLKCVLTSNSSNVEAAALNVNNNALKYNKIDFSNVGINSSKKEITSNSKKLNSLISIPKEKLQLE